MQKQTILILLFSTLFFSQACQKNEMTETTQTTLTPPIIPVSEPISYLALGDSYTIGESVPESGRWPVQLVNELRATNIGGIEVKEPQIIAQTGWTTGNLRNAIEQTDLTNDFDLVSLLIGVNNQYQGLSIEAYEMEFEELLLTSVALANGDKDRVFVLSIPDYGVTPFGAANEQYIFEQIDAFNAVNRRITEEHGIAYFDITPISRQAKQNPTLIANDGLHPSAEMYGLWVEFALKEVTALITE